MTRRRVAVALVVLCALAMVGAAVSWLAVRVWGPALTSDRIEQVLADALGRPARVDGVALEPLRGRVRVHGLSVAGAPGSRDPMLRVERIDIAIRIESVWRRELVVGITARGVDLRVEAEPGPPRAIAFEMPERFQLGPVTGRIAGLRIEQGRFRYEDPGHDFALELAELSAEARPDGGGLELSARAGTLHLRVGSVRETLAGAVAEGRVDAARILVRRVDLGGDGREIRARGAIESPWREPVLAMEAQARFGLGALARRLGSTMRVEGEAVIEVALAGPLDSPVVSGVLRVARIGVGGIEARDLSASFRRDGRALTVPDLAGRLLGGRLAGSLAVPSDNPRDAVARARLTGADVAALARAAGVQIDARGRIELDAEVRGDLSRLAAMHGHLRAEGSELSLPGELARLGAGRLSGLARVGGGHVTSEIEARWPGASLNATARLDPDQRVRLQARGRADLSALPGWATRDAVDVLVQGEGPWPRVALSAGVDLSRPAVRRGAGRMDLRLDPVPGPEPRWSGDVRARRLSLPWADVEDLRSALALSAEAIEVARLAARVASVPVEGSGRWTWRGSGDLRATVGPVALAALPGVDPGLALEGSARAEIRVSVSEAGLQGSARVEAERVGVARVPVGRANGQAVLRGRRLEASLRLPERQLEMSAQGDLAPGQTVTSRLSLRSLDLEPLVGPGQGGDRPLVRGILSAEADLAIAVDAPHNVRGTIALEPRTLALAGIPWNTAGPVVIRVDGSRATLEPARLTGPAGVITASGILWDARAPALVQVTLEQGRLAALVPSLGLEGRVGVEGELTGAPGAVAGTRARARLTGAGVILPGALAALGGGGGRFEAALADGVVSLTRGEVTWPGLTGEVTGRAGLDGRLTFDARASVDAERLGTALGRGDLAGRVTASAALTGRIGQLEGRGRLTAPRLIVAGVAFEQLDASARLHGERLRLERLTGRLLGAPLRAQGEWTPGGTGRGELEAGPIALAQITGLPEALALSGSLSLRVEATGDRATAQVRMAEVRAAGLSLGAGRLAARLDGRRLSADLALAESRVTATAAGTLAPGGAIEASLELTGLDLAPLVRHLAPEPSVDIEAAVTGRITARVPWDRPSLTARARLEPILLRARGVGLEGRGRIEARFENDLLVLERAELAGTLGEGRAAGTLDAGGRVDVRLDARVPLQALLTPVSGIGGSEGTVVVRGHLAGTLAAPALGGEAALTGGRIAFQGIREPLRDINARIVAAPGTIRLVEATATLGAGQLRASGEAALQGRVLGAYRLRLTARDLPLQPLDGLATVWNADFDLSGVERRALLSGDARLVRGTYARDLVALSALTAPEQVPRAPGVALPLRVRVVLDDNLVIRTPQARLRVGGSLTLQGTTANPVILGALEAREGTVLLRGYRYQIERAVVRLADPRRMDPVLDVAATTRIGEYDVTMRVTGHLRNLDIRLSSSPPLTRDELLSLVAFGTPRGETGQGAGGAFAGEAAKLVASELLDLSGTDSVLPEPVRKIMERTRVSYTHNAEDVGRFGLRVEYEVGGPFLVAGERTSQGYYVLDGVVRLRFR